MVLESSPRIWTYYPCPDLTEPNEPSRRAAARLGFTYEGRFRNAMVYRGRNRDTDWFSITDAEWPAMKVAVESWLAPDNFDQSGIQRRSLAVERGRP
jgi:hypothetical protein